MLPVIFFKNLIHISLKNEEREELFVDMLKIESEHLHKSVMLNQQSFMCKLNVTLMGHCTGSPLQLYNFENEKRYL
jgi:hypothetical protein